MDPDAVALAGITTLDLARIWTATDGVDGDALMTALGGPTLIRELTLVPKALWDSTVAALQVPSAALPPVLRNPTPMEIARITSLRRVARLRCGLSADEDGQAAQVAPPNQLAIQGPLPHGAVPPPPPYGSIKMSAVIDQSKDIIIKDLPGPVIRQMYADYEMRQGAEPSQEIEPSENQLSALWQLLESGSIPYADMGIFGPSAVRLAKKQTYAARHYNPIDGSWSTTELKGPASFDTWWLCWRVYRCAMLLCEACPVEHLHNYAEFIRKHANNFGPQCWFIVYQADLRCRSEHFERLRRKCEKEHRLAGLRGTLSTYQPAKPWETVFARAIEDKSFWDDEVRDACMLYLGRVKSAAEVQDDGTVHPEILNNHGVGPESSSRPARFPQSDRSPPPSNKRVEGDRARERR